MESVCASCSTGHLKHPIQELAIRVATLIQGTILACKMKLEKSEPFNGIPLKLQNFLFNVQLCSGFCGVISSTEMIKVAVTLLMDKALTRWRLVL